jgi:hypothetical protein
LISNNQKIERGKLCSINEILKSAMPDKLVLHIKIDGIKERWNDVVDEALVSRSFPVMFEYDSDGNGVYLLIHVSSPAAAQRIKMLGSRISVKLKELWQIEITGVRVKVI